MSIWEVPVPWCDQNFLFTLRCIDVKPHIKIWAVACLSNCVLLLHDTLSWSGKLLTIYAVVSFSGCLSAIKVCGFSIFDHLARWTAPSHERQSKRRLPRRQIINESTIESFSGTECEPGNRHGCHYRHRAVKSTEYNIYRVHCLCHSVRTLRGCVWAWIFFLLYSNKLRRALKINRNNC